jgi:hypothetical protein
MVRAADAQKPCHLLQRFLGGRLQKRGQFGHYWADANRRQLPHHFTAPGWMQLLETDQTRCVTEGLARPTSGAAASGRFHFWLGKGPVTICSPGSRLQDLGLSTGVSKGDEDPR